MHILRMLQRNVCYDLTHLVTSGETSQKVFYNWSPTVTKIRLDFWLFFCLHSCGVNLTHTKKNSKKKTWTNQEGRTFLGHGALTFMESLENNKFVVQVQYSIKWLSDSWNNFVLRLFQCSICVLYQSPSKITEFLTWESKYVFTSCALQAVIIW